jgi:hypothetical protein
MARRRGRTEIQAIELGAGNSLGRAFNIPGSGGLGAEVDERAKEAAPDNYTHAPIARAAQLLLARVDEAERSLSIAYSRGNLDMDGESQLPVPLINGQWLWIKEEAGSVSLDIDLVGIDYICVAHFYPIDATGPKYQCHFSLPMGNREYKNVVAPVTISHAGFRPRNESDGPLTTQIELDLNVERDAIEVNWRSNTGEAGSCNLSRSRGHLPSELISVQTEWKEFKEKIELLDHGQYIYRGQQKPWRLRTTFHRSGRANIPRFMREDVQMLHRRISGRTRHHFNLTDGDQQGAFYNLIQHHGYPTPLLDWTFSPFVAAFFAYRGVSREQIATNDRNDRVRIYVIDKQACQRLLPPILPLIGQCLHFSLLEFVAVENPRLIPQQSISGVSNIDDIEGYLLSAGTLHKERILWAYDLPAAARPQVMKDLNMMGITAGSLFPSLDGTCEELRERMFPNL